MKKKLLSIVAVIAVVFIAAVLFRVDRFIYGDRLNWAEAQARSQLVAIHQAVQIELKSLQRVLFSFSAETFRQDKINWNTLQPSYAVASMSVEDHGKLRVQNLIVKGKSPAYNWNADFVNKALADVVVRGGKGLQTLVKPFQDAGRGRHVAVIFANGGKAYALIGAGETFQSLVDAQRGSLNSFSIVTTDGLTVAHSIPEYVGTLVADDPVYKAAKDSGASQGAGVFESTETGSRFGVYDQIGTTNLVILSSVSMTDLMKGRAGLMWQFVFLGLGLILVGVGGMLWVIMPQEKSLEQLRRHLLSLVSGKKDFHPQGLTADIQELDELVSSLPSTSAPAAAATVVSAEPSMGVDKMEAYRKVAAALGHEMRGPLTSILGHSQVILSHSENPDVVSSTESILRESRSARQILEKLFSFAGEKESEKTEMKVEGPLAGALRNLEPLFQEKGVRVKRDLQETASLPVDPLELIQAFENILRNSVEAMERMTSKELNVKLYEDEAGVHVEIADTGEGMDPEAVPQAFDPFFTTRSFQNHTGLGLAVVMGILKDHHADVSLASERGRGTTFTAVFKKQSAKKAAPKLQFQVRESEELEKTAADIVLPSELPPAPATAHREEEKKIAEQVAAPDVAPTEVNIENLLELPPVSGDEFTFIDGFLDDQPKSAPAPTVASASAKGGKQPPPPPPLKRPPAQENENVSEETVLQEMAQAPVDQDLPPPPLAGPKRAPPKKKSPLDSYEVDLRKGKRL